MKKLFLVVFCALALGTTYAQQILVVKNHRPKSVIVIPANPSPADSKAATYLQTFIEQMSGAKLDIKPDNTTATGPEILIGNVNRTETKDVATAGLNEDAFIIRNINDKLVITGGSDMGTVYGVNELVEKYLGYRRFTSKVSYIPKHKTISFKTINDSQSPAFTYRRTSYRDAFAGDFADWNRVNNNSNWGAWVHTYNTFLDNKVYGNSHPEYFSFYGDKRHPESNAAGEPVAQLCLSNPAVFDIVYENLKAAIAKNPAAKYWSVSQNDNVNYCRCAECAKIDAQYAAATSSDVYATGNTKYASTGMGSVLYFTNRIAEKFPDKVISTLAYQYTRKPPVGLKPLPNVNIMLCSIESPRNVPMPVGDKPFTADLEGWGKLTKDILIWDYTIQFRNLLAPFPNLRTLQPNVQFLKSNNVTSLFEQGNRESGGESAELRAYLLTRLMWNTDANVDSLINDFVSGYYGKAGPMVHKYLDLIHDRMEQTNTKLTMFGSPVLAKETFLSASLINVYNKLFDEAERAVRKSPEMVSRVKTARLPVYYAMLEIAKSEKTGPRGAFITDANGAQKPNPEIEVILNKFVSQCIATGVTRIAEWNTIPQDYLEAYNDFLAGRPAKPVVRLF